MCLQKQFYISNCAMFINQNFVSEPQHTQGTHTNGIASAAGSTARYSVMCRAHPHLMLPLTTTTKDKLIKIHMSLQKPLGDEPCGQKWSQSSLRQVQDSTRTCRDCRETFSLSFIHGWKGLNHFGHDCISYIGRETQRDRERKGPFFPYITTSAQRRLSFLLLIQVKVSVEARVKRRKSNSSSMSSHSYL